MIYYSYSNIYKEASPGFVNALRNLQAYSKTLKSEFGILSANTEYNLLDLEPLADEDLMQGTEYDTDRIIIHRTRLEFLRSLYYMDSNNLEKLIYSNSIQTNIDR